MGGGEYCDAKRPGLYAALEKAYKAMTIAAFTGRHPCIGQGLLEEGRTLSAVQLLLDRELGEGLQQFGRSINPTPENIGLLGIVEVDLGMETSHMELDHTLRHFRSCLWLPEFIERAGWNGFESEAQILDKVQSRVNALIAEYTKPADREEKLVAMRAVVERAKKALLD